MRIILLSLLIYWWDPVTSLDNGLALTPPMGWLTWQRYRCTIDCKNKPDECISEKLIMNTVDYMVSDGYLKAGYNYIGIDDCWMEKQRDSDGKLVADKERFPRGMKFLGDYIHGKGLKFGIYEDFGSHTCEGYPGSQHYEEIDAKTFAEWGVDYVKLDGCNVDVNLMDEGYPKFGNALNATGRPMLYSCSWPFYQEIIHNMLPDYESIIKHCNMWRNYYDIQNSWSSVESIIKYFGANSKRFATYAGPGHWNDPDMLVVGNSGLNYERSKVQMVIWAILGAPLLISADLGRMKPELRDILIDKQILEVNQDILGRAGIMVLERDGISVWVREVMPIVSDIPSMVIAFVNHNSKGGPKTEYFTMEELQIDIKMEFDTNEIFHSDTQDYKIEYIDGKYGITATINPTGVLTVKLVYHLPYDDTELRNKIKQ